MLWLLLPCLQLVAFLFVLASFLVSSFLLLRTFAPADALAPPPLPAACCFSFCACIISCLFISASSRRFFFSSASLAFFRPLPCEVFPPLPSFVDLISFLVQP